MKISEQPLESDFTSALEVCFMDMQDLSHCQSQLLPKFGAEAASTLLGKWNEACQNRIHVAACKHMDPASTSQQSQIHCFLKSGWSCESSSWMFITSSCFSHCSIWEVATETHAHSPTRPLALSLTSSFWSLCAGRDMVEHYIHTSIIHLWHLCQYKIKSFGNLRWFNESGWDSYASATELEIFLVS